MVGAYSSSEWFRRWTATSLPPEFDHTLMSWDMTFKDSKNSDYVVGQVWGKKGPNFYLLDQVRGQWDFVKTKEMVRVLAHKWPRVVRKLVEDKANGSAVISELKSTVSGFVPITPTESKEPGHRPSLLILRQGMFLFRKTVQRLGCRITSVSCLSFLQVLTMTGGQHNSGIELFPQRLRRHSDPRADAAGTFRF